MFTKESRWRKLNVHTAQKYLFLGPHGHVFLLSASSCRVIVFGIHFLCLFTSPWFQQHTQHTQHTAHTAHPSHYPSIVSAAHTTHTAHSTHSPNSRRTHNTSNQHKTRCLKKVLWEPCSFDIRGKRSPTQVLCKYWRLCA